MNTIRVDYLRCQQRISTVLAISARGITVVHTNVCCARPASLLVTISYLTKVVVVGHQPGADYAANTQQERCHKAERAEVFKYAIRLEQVEDEKAWRDHVVEGPEDRQRQKPTEFSLHIASSCSRKQIINRFASGLAVD